MGGLAVQEEVIASSFEALLFVGAVGAYLYDSLEFLHFNEFVLLHRGGRWRYVYPSATWQLLGRRPFMPNPLRPDMPVYIVSWSDRSCGEGAIDGNGIAPHEARIAFLRWPVRALLLLLLVLLPAALLWGGDAVLLGVFAAAYLLVALAVLAIHRRRRGLGLNGREVLSIGIESMACPPFALNLYRRFTCRSHVIEEPLQFARGKLPADDYRRLVDDVCARIDEQLGWVDEHLPRHASLLALRHRVTESVS